MVYVLICSALIAASVGGMYAYFRKPKPAKAAKQPIKFEEALIDFTPKKGYLPMFGRNHRLT
ncbi:hypothetical protein [Cesiribacter andamanensis]|uniref:Uncharacterized protein n=1 Tax=Cesiribacter andamanensis AMV16 TaxID=1279009 RepID=M7N9V7_9BACT|nr:hypothetical protein [Cesiribacter andamanensis]EMR03991.1 hypothetical protein ADICEAN_00862 [Cesiribacter andamanensis AMV16]